jgi:excisionase family DNA binding protein
MSSNAATLAPGPWLDSDRAWAYAGFPSRKALYHAVRRGQIPAHRLGKRRLRFNRAELDHFLAAAPAFRR